MTKLRSWLHKGISKKKLHTSEQPSIWMLSNKTCFSRNSLLHPIDCREDSKNGKNAIDN